MSLTHEVIDVRVSEQILWFGSEAFPLRNITRTNTLTLTPNRGAAIRSYVLFVVLLLVAAAAVAGAVGGVTGIIAFVAAIAAIVYRTIKLIDFLNHTLYELVIETSSGTHRGLVTTDGNAVTDLSRRIMEAINNPRAEFQTKVDVVHNHGDTINLTGSHSVGKFVQ